MGQKSKFMKLVHLLLFHDSTVKDNCFFDKRANGKYRVKIVYPRKKYTPAIKEKLEQLPHVIEVKYAGFDFPEYRKERETYFNGISITLDCRPSKAM